MSPRDLVSAAVLVTGITAVGLGGAAEIVQTHAELDAAEQRIAQLVSPAGGRAGSSTDNPDGVTRAEVRAIAERIVAADRTATKQRITRLVAEAIAAQEPAQDGQDGALGTRGPQGGRGQQGRPGGPGRPGSDGDDGAPGRDGADGRTPTPAEVRAIVEDVIEANPPAPGEPGPPGTSVVSASITHDGRLVLALSDGTTLDAGPLPTPEAEDGDPYCPAGFAQTQLQGHFYNAPDGRAVVLVCTPTPH